MKSFLSIVVWLLLGINGFAQQSMNFKSNHKKVYSKDCTPCKDPWVGEVFYKVWGTCPATISEVAEGMCNIKMWNNGSWNSKDHLEQIIFDKFTGYREKGVAYAFVKPENVNGAGHIGWGFVLSDGSYYAGSTENYGAGYWVNAGGDNNMWGELFYSEQAMFNKMKALGYSLFRKTNVNYPKIAAAKRRVDETKMKGFQGVSNNCLDHTYQILEAYGVKNLPNRQWNVTPNGWFNQFK